jgi:hypothetical protein
MVNHLLPHQRPDQAKHLWKGVRDVRDVRDVRGVRDQRDQWTTHPLWHLKCCKLLGPGFGSQAFFSVGAKITSRR